MARNRLAAMRNNNNGYDDFQNNDSYQNSVPSYRVATSGRNRDPNPSASSLGSYDDEKSGYDSNRRQQNQQQPFQSKPIEMRRVGTGTGAGRGTRNQQRTTPREVSSTENFFDSIANLQVDLKELQHFINTIEDLSKRSLDTRSDEERQELQSESEILSNDIRQSSQSIKSAIQSFEADHSLLRQRGDPDGNLNVRVDQLAALKKRFIETVQRYAQVEQSSRKAIRAKVERQVKIVKPDATDSEVRAAVEDEINGNGAVFQQALVSSNRMGSARNALREVQSRAEDIKRIEQTITELATLFNDMATMVEEQDVQVQHIEKQAETVHQDVEAATVELKTAVVSAQGARNKRKCCFWLIMVIILVLGGGIAIYILFKNGVIGGSGNNGSAPAASGTTTSTPASSTATTARPAGS